MLGKGPDQKRKHNQADTFQSNRQSKQVIQHRRQYIRTKGQRWAPMGRACPFTFIQTRENPLLSVVHQTKEILNPLYTKDRNERRPKNLGYLQQARSQSRACLSNEANDSVSAAMAEEFLHSMPIQILFPFQHALKTP